MSGEAKDPAIKLFGKTISLPDVPPPGDAAGAVDTGQIPCADPPPPPPPSPGEDTGGGNDEVGEEEEEEGEEGGGDRDDKGTRNEKSAITKLEYGAQFVNLEEGTNQDAISVTNENPRTPSVDRESTTPKTSKSEEEQSDTSNSQEKVLKKPDKILPCPRCNSMDTKFCYYNNYNVNQPRHFCKNCQRYWTAGGTMRNVPVGAGRRKNKNSASHYRHLAVPEALQSVRSDFPNGVHHPPVKPNGTVLTFGSDTPLCESMASVLHLADKAMHNCRKNGFHKPEGVVIPTPGGSARSGVENMNGSSATAANSNRAESKNGTKEIVMPNCQGFPPQLPCFPGAPWPYAWNSAPWSPPISSGPQTFCPPGFAVPFYPGPAYWSCGVPGAWNIPWVAQPTSPNHSATSSGPNSPTLGKHSRDEKIVKPNHSTEEEPQKEANPERSLWIPKTLRIDDPGEAAKSSIWATLGIKNEASDSAGRGVLFKAFRSKSEEKNHVVEASSVLQANPAAMSRSLNFQESL
ncbi:hypothetical protein NL676_014878 [Syzygium grande]|nr:hypothetical protein NL676_014878 [Syzygium grande]